VNNKLLAAKFWTIILVLASSGIAGISTDIVPETTARFAVPVKRSPSIVVPLWARRWVVIEKSPLWKWLGMKRSKLGQAFSMPFSLDKLKVAGIWVVGYFYFYFAMSQSARSTASTPTATPRMSNAAMRP
jgi:hypothetical protein